MPSYAVRSLREARGPSRDGHWVYVAGQRAYVTLQYLVLGGAAEEVIWTDRGHWATRFATVEDAAAAALVHGGAVCAIVEHGIVAIDV